MIRTLLAVLASQLLALGALAQTDAGGAEFTRGSGGTIDAVAKKPRRFSGSLSITQSNAGSGHGGTLGGEIVDDRLWFFAAAAVLPRIHSFATEGNALAANADAQPVDWTAVTASFSRLQQPLTLSPTDLSAPTSFLSLRSTSVISDRMILNFSVSRSTGTRNVFPLAAPDAQ